MRAIARAAVFVEKERGTAQQFWRSPNGVIVVVLADLVKTVLKRGVEIGGLASHALFGPLLALLGPDGLSPIDCIRTDIPYEDRQTVARGLAVRSTMNPTGGIYGLAYMGWADCRICGERLGTRDMIGLGFIWPEKAEHYITHHNVWTRECDDFLIALRKSGAR